MENKTSPKKRPRITRDMWDALAKIGGDVGVSPREAIGFLVKNYNQEPAADHSFKFGDPKIFPAVLDNDCPILIRGKARIGKTRSARAIIERIKDDHPVLIFDPQGEYEGQLIKLEGLFNLFENSPNGVFVLRLNRESRDMSRLELINALRILTQKIGLLKNWVVVVEEISSRFADIQELHSYFSEAAKFTFKTLGVEQTSTILDGICKIVEIVGGDNH